MKQSCVQSNISLDLGVASSLFSIGLVRLKFFLQKPDQVDRGNFAKSGLK